MPRFYEFFAGGGMARAGFGPDWTCLFANDFDEKKARSYRANWGGEHLRVGDVNLLSADDLPGRAHLAWASFPCQDLSQAGNAQGIGRAEDEVRTRSGSFWAFWRIMGELQAQGRAPAMIVLENVCGALTSNQGRDFAAIAQCFAKGGYRFGAMVVDAQLFLPQSRPRLFVLGIRAELPLPAGVTASGPTEPWHPKTLAAAHAKLPKSARAAWLWWNPPVPGLRNSTFADVIEDRPQGCDWHSPQQTQALLDLMHPRHLAKVRAAQAAGRRMVGGVYKRTRIEDGVKVQRAEVRFDDVAGCLRTPAGGSSRQSILVVDGDLIRSRLLSPREGARLMGLPDDYVLPDNYTESYHLTGDGVAVAVVRHLVRTLIEPILGQGEALSAA